VLIRHLNTGSLLRLTDPLRISGPSFIGKAPSFTVEEPVEGPRQTIPQKPKTVVADELSQGSPDGRIALGVGGEDPPRVGTAQPKPRPFPFLHGSLKAEEVFHPALHGKPGLSVRAVKVDEERLFIHDQEVLKLEIPMEKACVVKSPDKETNRSQELSFW